MFHYETALCILHLALQFGAEELGACCAADRWRALEVDQPDTRRAARPTISAHGGEASHRMDHAAGAQEVETDDHRMDHAAGAQEMETDEIRHQDEAALWRGEGQVIMQYLCEQHLPVPMWSTASERDGGGCCDGAQARELETWRYRVDASD